VGGWPRLSNGNKSTIGCPTLSRSLRRVGPASQCSGLLCRFTQTCRKKQVLDAENPAPAQWLGLLLQLDYPEQPIDVVVWPGGEE
jgi:hypothetical protein